MVYIFQHNKALHFESYTLKENLIQKKLLWNTFHKSRRAGYFCNYLAVFYEFKVKLLNINEWNYILFYYREEQQLKLIMQELPLMLLSHLNYNIQIFPICNMKRLKLKNKCAKMYLHLLLFLISILQISKNYKLAHFLISYFTFWKFFLI